MKIQPRFTGVFLDNVPAEQREPSSTGYTIIHCKKGKRPNETYIYAYTTNEDTVKVRLERQRHRREGFTGELPNDNFMTSSKQLLNFERDLAEQAPLTLMSRLLQVFRRRVR